MKRTKIFFGFASVSIFPLISFMDKANKQTLSYFAGPCIHGVATLPTTAQKNSINYLQNLHTTVPPPTGSMPGSCGANSGFVCAALFTVTVNDTAGRYQGIWVTGEYHCL